MKPQWTVYKNDQAISQAVTWHQALANLVTLEDLESFSVTYEYHGYILVSPTSVSLINNRYRIIKER